MNFELTPFQVKSIVPVNNCKLNNSLEETDLHAVIRVTFYLLPISIGLSENYKILIFVFLCF